MRVKVFAVYDIRAELFGSIFTFSHVGQAVRAFKDLANDRNSSVSRHPGDYKLAEIGEFDDVNGTLNAADVQYHGFASDYVELPSAPVEVLRGRS